MADADLLLFHPPRRTDVIFREDRTLWPVNASVGWLMKNGDPDPPYSEGYRIAARQIAQGVCAEGERGFYSDYLVYPVVFLYRHHLELVLKRILAMIADLAEEALDQKSSKDMEKHQLDQLWANVKRFLRKELVRNSGLAIDCEDVEGIDSYIEQLSKVDPDSQAFRYARDKKGKRSIPEHLKSFNIAIFSDHMERLCNYLDGVASHLDHTLDVRAEMMAESMEYDEGY